MDIGKIFRKFNLVDLLVLSFIFLVILAFFARAFMPQSILKKIRRMPQQEEVYVEVLLNKEKQWLKDYVKIGDGQRDLENNFMAQVIDIKDYFQNGEICGKIVVLKLRASIDSYGFIKYGSNILRPGQDFILENKDYVLRGVVFSVKREKQ
ncbi:MAG: DUF4330 domain-containing protein [Candidatus Omnitrophica bacterium]|nr:DUF4330 domain-containing protein [Candidatus Omnitrophota bacterium]